MSADFGGFQTKEAQSKALSKAIRDSQQTYSNEWKKYSRKPWAKRATNENLSDSQLSQKLLNEKKLDDTMKRLDEIDTQILDIQARKDELKSIESMKVNSRTNIQVKMVSNQAYQTLLSKEQSLESERNKLTNQVQKYQNNMDKIDLASQTGKIFSAGIKMEPAMDTRSRDIAPVTSGAMSPVDRAEAYDKQGSLIDPNFSLNDVAQGAVNQIGLSSKPTILDNAITSPFKDMSTMIQDPKQYQQDLDYGYDAMTRSAKEISKEPDKFTGNVIGEGALAFGLFGTGKIPKGGKIVSKVFTSKEINKAEKLVQKAEMNKLNVDPKIQSKVSKEMKKFYDETGLNPNNNVDLIRIPTPQEKTLNTRKALDKIGDDLGTTIYTGYTNKNAKKYTGIGVGIGALGFGINETKNKKSSVFNFKY